MVKVLFVASERLDYVQECIYHGLQELGADIWPFPSWEKYRKPGNWGKYEALTPKPNKNKINDLTKVDLSSFDKIIIASSWKDVLPVVSYLLKHASKEKIVFLDGVDDPFLRTRLIGKVGKYYKREMLRKDWAACNYYFARLWNMIKYNLPFFKAMLLRPTMMRIYWQGVSSFNVYDDRILPLQFSIPERLFKAKKSIDILFIGTMSSRKREKVLELVENYAKRNQLKAVTKITSKLSWKEYIELLSSAKVCISMRGAGMDTFRYWEIPCAGSLLLSEEPLIDIPNNFKDKESAVFFKSLVELEEKLDFLFSNPKVIPKITKKGREKVLKYHTTKERAKRVLNGR
ncbi:glycosyltransferase [Nanoarchaeota archaeon]